MEPKYKRVILKISGEALAGDKHVGLDEEMLDKVALEVKQIRDMGVQVAVVVGGGNFWRGRTSSSMDRSTADYMGMLATVINSLALQDAFERNGMPTRVQTAIEMREVAEPYIRRRAINQLNKNIVVILAQESETRSSPQTPQRPSEPQRPKRTSFFWPRKWTPYTTVIRSSIRTPKSTIRSHIRRSWRKILKLWIRRRLPSAGTTASSSTCSPSGSRATSSKRSAERRSEH